MIYLIFNNYENFFSGLTLLALFSTAPASANFLKKFTDSIPNPETMLDKNQRNEIISG